VQLAIRQRVDEELRLPDRRRLERRHNHERGALVGQGARHGPGALDEAVVHGLEQQEELGDVLQELGTEDAVGHRVEGLRRHREHPAPGRHREPPQQAAGEEVGHPFGRFQEVDGVPGRRRVHEDQVVATRGVDLVQPLHRDVVVALHEPARDVGVERVGEDGVAGGGVGGVGPHQLVPRLLGVEHRRPELPPRLGDAGGGEVLGWYLRLHVAESLQPEGVGQPPCRVHGDHQHLSAVVGRGHGRGCRRRRGLAHAARSTADHDLLGGQQRLQRRRSLGPGRRPTGHQ
jgi:hypothetical protein